LNISGPTTYIAGYGTEQIDQNPMVQPYFVGETANDTPSKLNGFINGGVSYNSTTGQIDCTYHSQNALSDFVVSYVLTNGRGGIVQNNTQNMIVIAVPMGLKS
jgi:hypothetical protein